MPDVRFKRAYPLQWPKGRARTSEPQESRFDTGMRDAVSYLKNEIRLLGGDNIRLTMNKLPPRVGELDPGVSVYFMLDGEVVAMACDRWDRRCDNVHAIAKTIAAKRGEARWGATDVRQSFAGHMQALPPTGAEWRAVLDLDSTATLVNVRTRYRDLARKAHPDHGGNPAEMTRLNAAFEAAKAELAN